MAVPYRIVEVYDSTEWIPVGVALPYQGEVGVYTLGRDKPRRVSAPGVDRVTSEHLWADNVRWGSLAQCTREQAGDPRRLLRDVVVKTDAPRDPLVEEIIKRGATMEELAGLKEPVAQTPEEALQALKRGNSRFFSGRPSVQNLTPMERRAQSLSQTPFAVIVGCSDSRVPVEIVFDQGPGNLFIVRVAGNVMGSSAMGSIEYGVGHLKSHLVVILGHEGCGAVAAALQPAHVRDAEPDNIRGLLNRIVPAVDNLPRIRDRKARMREAVTSNVRLQVHTLNKNAAIQQHVRAGKIAIVGAYYSISSGCVDFLETEEDLALDFSEPSAPSH